MKLHYCPETDALSLEPAVSVDGGFGARPVARMEVDCRARLNRPYDLTTVIPAKRAARKRREREPGPINPARW